MAADLLISNVPDDWSGTGRGPHVDFGVNEIVPLQAGDFLGQGGDAIVYETTVHKIKVAWKKTSRQRKSNANVRLEIEILKKLNHQHLVRLIGSYTHKRSVGMLLYPVAVCDLGTFFEDAEAYWQDNAAEDQDMRLRQLGYSSESPIKHKAWPVYSQIGCLISAVAYLHSQSIRHKDLKPSNILLSPGRLYLSDFGLSTDFSLLSQSGTDGGAGTARYKAPEVADLQRSGRAADIFSLGCVLLEILVFDQDGTLCRLRPISPTSRFVYHENLEKIDNWLPWAGDLSPVRLHLCLEIRSMLSRFPKQRPCVDELVSRISLCDKMTEETRDRIFSDCCRVSYITERQFKSRIKALQVQIQSLRQEKQLLQRHHIRTVAERNSQEEAEDFRRQLNNRVGLIDRRLYDVESQTWTHSDYQIYARQWAKGVLNKALKVLTNPYTTRYDVDKSVIHFSPSRVEKIVDIIITAFICTILILPAVLMYRVTAIGGRNSNLHAVGIIVVFTLLFSSAMSLLTKAKRHELFAASAAYCAVLVVFISNSTDNRCQPQHLQVS